MKIKANMAHMVKCKDLFKDHTQYALFSKALAHLINEANFFEKCIHSKNPFKEHFHKSFQESVEKEEECFALHEDIIIFFREKALRFGLNNLEEIELEVLKDFEAKSHESNSLLAKWYFEKLPLLMYKELTITLESSENAYQKWQG